MTHRGYNPRTGRFLSRDPIGYEGGINLYTYASNNPVTHADPSGLTDGIDIGDQFLLGAGFLFGGLGGGLGGGGAAGAVSGGALAIPGAALGAIKGAAAGTVAAGALVIYKHVLFHQSTSNPQLTLPGMDGFKRKTSKSGGAQNGKNSDAAVNDLMQSLGGGIKNKFFANANGGKKGSRFVDLYFKREAHEIKLGYTTLSDFAKKQIAKDATLLRDGKADSVIWHFYNSPIINKGGGSAQLLKELRR